MSEKNQVELGFDEPKPSMIDNYEFKYDVFFYYSLIFKIR